MTTITLQPRLLPSPLHIPPSKSHTLRAILLGTFARGTTHITNFLESPDTDKILAACGLLGAVIERGEGELFITGTSCPKPATLDLGNSGIALRFLTGILATFEGKFILTGDTSLQRRPMQPLYTALSTLRTGEVTVEGSDSQMVSALILAALFLKNPLVIHVKNPGEKPWVALTLKWLERLGISYENDNFTKIVVEGRGGIDAFDYTVPADFSSLSYPVAAALITGQSIEIPALDFSDPQGDKMLLSVLEKMGARFEIIEGSALRVLASPLLEGITIDVNPIIDALPLLAVIGCFAKGKTTLMNGAVARTKECDRIAAISQELKKMGARIEEHADGLTVYHSRLHGADVDSHGDQRMVLALSIAAFIADGPVRISDYMCYTKTFPNFFSVLNLKKTYS